MVSPLPRSTELVTRGFREMKRSRVKQSTEDNEDEQINDLESKKSSSSKNTDEFRDIEKLKIEGCCFNLCCNHVNNNFCCSRCGKENNEKTITLLYFFTFFISFEQNVLTGSLPLYQKAVNEKNEGSFSNVAYGSMITFMTAVDLGGRPLIAALINCNMDKYLYLGLLSIVLIIFDWVLIFAYLYPSDFTDWKAIIYISLFFKTFSDSKNVFDKSLLEFLAGDDAKVSVLSKNSTLSYLGGTLGFTFTMVIDLVDIEGFYKWSHVIPMIPLGVCARIAYEIYTELQKPSNGEKKGMNCSDACKDMDGCSCKDVKFTDFLHIPFLFWNQAIFMTLIGFAVQYLDKVHSITDGIEILLKVSVPYLLGIFLGNWIQGGYADVKRLNIALKKAQNTDDATGLQNNDPVGALGFCAQGCCCIKNCDCNEDCKQYKEKFEWIKKFKDDDGMAEPEKLTETDEEIQNRKMNFQIVYSISFVACLVGALVMTIYYGIVADTVDPGPGPNQTKSALYFSIMVFTCSFLIFAAPTENAVVYSLPPKQVEWGFVLAGFGYVATIAGYTYFLGQEFDEADELADLLKETAEADPLIQQIAETAHDVKVAKGYENGALDLSKFAYIGCLVMFIKSSTWCPWCDVCADCFEEEQSPEAKQEVEQPAVL